MDRHRAHGSMMLIEIVAGMRFGSMALTAWLAHGQPGIGARDHRVRVRVHGGTPSTLAIP
jgi:hypothetical protein